MTSRGVRWRALIDVERVTSANFSLIGILPSMSFLAGRTSIPVPGFVNYWQEIRKPLRVEAHSVARRTSPSAANLRD